MMRWFFSLPPLGRAIAGLVLIGISTALYFFGDTIWPYGWIVGGITLALSIPSKKTHDWGDW